MRGREPESGRTDGPEDTQSVEQALWALYAELRETLVPYKRASIVDDPL